MNYVHLKTVGSKLSPLPKIKKKFFNIRVKSAHLLIWNLFKYCCSGHLCHPLLQWGQFTLSLPSSNQNLSACHNATLNPTSNMFLLQVPLLTWRGATHSLHLMVSSFWRKCSHKKHCIAYILAVFSSVQAVGRICVSNCACTYKLIVLTSQSKTFSAVNCLSGWKAWVTKGNLQYEILIYQWHDIYDRFIFDMHISADNC